MFKILVVENYSSPSLQDELVTHMNRLGIAADILSVQDNSNAINALESDEHFDILIIDLPADANEGFKFLLQAKEMQPWINRILVTDKSDFLLAMRAINTQMVGYLQKPIDPDIIDSIIFNLYPEYRKTTTSTTETPHLSEADEDSLINRILDIIAQEYHNDISLTYLAEQVHFSPCYLSSLFRQKVGSRLMSYINCYRIDKAALLLKTTDMRVAEIGASVGFRSPPYFCTMFKRQFGLTPAQYRDDVAPKE